MTSQKKIINVKGKNYERFYIVTLLKYSRDKELIKNLLLQNGIDYKLINDEIKMYNRDESTYVSLIPDNYPSMLNEIKRIKEIMR